MAYAYIKRNDKGDLNHAIENLTAVYKQLQEHILTQFQLQLIMLGTLTALEQQISTKMNLVQTWLTYIEHALAFIQANAGSDKKLRSKMIGYLWSYLRR